MPGTPAGGHKAAAKNRKRDPDFYRRIGAKGGRISKTGGFYADRELASIAGKIGGLKGRRLKNGNKGTPIKVDSIEEATAKLQAYKQEIKGKVAS